VVELAEDIARNQGHLPDDELALMIANHLKLFWDPRMREELRRIVVADPSAVSPVVAAAVSELTGR
jgi:formate dehydrogenase subunit delta